MVKEVLKLIRDLSIFFEELVPLLLLLILFVLFLFIKEGKIYSEKKQRSTFLMRKKAREVKKELRQLVNEQSTVQPSLKEIKKIYTKECSEINKKAEIVTKKIRAKAEVKALEAAEKGNDEERAGIIAKANEDATKELKKAKEAIEKLTLSYKDAKKLSRKNAFVSLTTYGTRVIQEKQFVKIAKRQAYRAYPLMSFAKKELEILGYEMRISELKKEIISWPELINQYLDKERFQLI